MFLRKLCSYQFERLYKIQCFFQFGIKRLFRQRNVFHSFQKFLNNFISCSFILTSSEKGYWSLLWIQKISYFSQKNIWLDWNFSFILLTSKKVNWQSCYRQGQEFIISWQIFLSLWSVGDVYDIGQEVL